MAEERQRVAPASRSVQPDSGRGPRRWQRGRRIVLLAFLATLLATCIWHQVKPLPAGVSFEGPLRTASDVALFIDDTWLDERGERQLSQEIFDELFRLIAQAQDFVLLDMFLYNDFQGPVPENHRALSTELTDALVSRKNARPGMEIVVITDSVNELYGGLPSTQFDRLREAGIRVVVTDLNALRDSNPAYSAFWRLFIRPFGNSPADTLPNPIGYGRVPVRSYLAMANFRANHRKTLVADYGDTWVGYVMSANPHDGSSAHRNAAVRFLGPAAEDLLVAENAVLAFSGAAPLEREYSGPAPAGPFELQVLTEGEIERIAVNMIDSARAGEKLDMYMFYLSNRELVGALERAQRRGVALRVLLDPNKDAFGREKNGVPNRQVGYELHRSGISVRWCATRGEQCHAKMLLKRDGHGRAALLSGSANFTRRNLSDYNLEANVYLQGAADAAPLARAASWFDASWQNADERTRSVAFEEWEDRSVLRRWQYRLMEWSGVSTF